MFRNTIRAVGAGVLACAAAAALAQDPSTRSGQASPADYPTRPIRLIVPVAPGAGNDIISRAAAQMIQDKWGQNVVVDNRAGGGTVIATELIAQSPPDGYTIGTMTDSLALLGAMKRVSFDIRTAMQPIVMMTSQPYILVVNPTLPAKSVKELIALSKSKPLSYGSSGVGTTVHLGMEKLAAVSGGKLVHVPYKGTAPALIGVMGGEIHMVPASAISATAAMKTGKVRGLAAMGLTRVPAMPDLPTVAEQGFPGFKIVNAYYLYAPAKTPRPIVMAIHKVVMDGMHSQQMAQRLVADGSQPGEKLSPEELKVQFARDYVEVEKQVKQLNIKMY